MPSIRIGRSRGPSSYASPKLECPARWRSLALSAEVGCCADTDGIATTAANMTTDRRRAGIDRLLRREFREDTIAREALGRASGRAFGPASARPLSLTAAAGPRRDRCAW